MDALRNSFTELIINGQNVASLLNFKFSLSGRIFWYKKKIDKTLFSADTENANHSVFKYVTCKEVHDLIPCFNMNKLLGPSFPHGR